MYSTTTTTPAQTLANKQQAQGFVTLIDVAEYTQALQAQVSTSQANRKWLAAHGLATVDPAEIFAAS